MTHHSVTRQGATLRQVRIKRLSAAPGGLLAGWSAAPGGFIGQSFVTNCAPEVFLRLLESCSFDNVVTILCSGALPTFIGVLLF